MILPPNALKQEQVLADIINYPLDINSLRGFKFNPQTEMLPWLVAEYGLGEILSWDKKLTTKFERLNDKSLKSALKKWVDYGLEQDPKKVIQNEIKFQRLRGTPQSLKMALRWANIDNITIQEEPPGEHFAEFQIGISDVPNDFFVDSVVALAKLAAPARSRLMRIYNSYYDVHRFILDQSSWGDILSDYSGIKLTNDGPVLAFGRFNHFYINVPFIIIIIGNFRSHYIQALSNDLYRLDVAILDETDSHTKNYESIYGRDHVLRNFYVLYPLPQTLLPPIRFAKALIVLSDSWDLGDINACFAPTAYEETEHTFYLSEDKLSEQIWNFRRTPILERFNITYHYEADNFLNSENQKAKMFSLIEHYIYFKNDLNSKQTDSVCEPSSYVAVSYPGVVTWHEHRHLNRPWRDFQPIISKKLDVFSTNLVYI